MGDDEDDDARRADLTTERTVSTTTKKFGLAWLFANTKRREERLRSRKRLQQAAKDDKDQIDERIAKTFMLFDVSMDEHRVSVKSNLKKKWRDEEADEALENCTSSQAEDSWKQDWTNRKLESRVGDKIVLRCALQDVHHEIDFENFHVQWIVQGHSLAKSSKEESQSAEKPEKGNPCKRKVQTVIGISSPKCKVYTEFPFDDLTTSTKDITCTSEMTIESASINDTGIYECKSKVGLEPISLKTDNRSSRAPLTYEISERIFIRVRIKDDYHVHKVVSLLLAVMIALVIASLVVKKIVRHKLGWEPTTENYAPAWPNSIPARKIASAGSLSQSKATLKERHISEPCIDEESDEDAEAEKDELKIDGFAILVGGEIARSRVDLGGTDQ